MKFTYAIKGEEKILVTPENRDSLDGYTFIQEENPILEIKAKYKQIILFQYSETDQANMTARVAEITTLCILESRTPTEEELTDIEVGKAMIAFIREQRALCEQEIAQI